MEPTTPGQRALRIFCVIFSIIWSVVRVLATALLMLVGVRPKMWFEKRPWDIGPTKNWTST